MTNQPQIPKIHFIHHLEKSFAPANLGDWISSPYYYFYEFFSRYTSIVHSDWAILWHEIEYDDVVIFGGGGLLDNSDPLNSVLNKLMEKCRNVIIWGAGTHKYNESNIFGMKPTSVEINFSKALYCGIRDYQHPYNQEFLPCASCLHPAFNISKNPPNIVRKVGTIKSALENNFAVSNVPSYITNAEPIAAVVEYIASSEVILVSSYHGAFWSLLLGKKVVLPSTRLGVDKYKYFRHPVGFYDSADYDEELIMRIASTLPSPINFLNEARIINYDFFNKVRNFIEKNIPISRETETIQNLAKRVAQLEFTLLEIWNHLRGSGKN